MKFLPITTPQSYVNNKKSIHYPQVLDELHKIGFKNDVVGVSNFRKILNKPFPIISNTALPRDSPLSQAIQLCSPQGSQADLVKIEPEPCILLKDFTPIPTQSYTKLKSENSHRTATFLATIEELCRFLEDNSIRLIQASCKEITNLCDILPDTQIKRKHIIRCFCGQEELSVILRVPGQQYRGQNARHNAATKLSATYKMHLVRRKYQRYWDHVFANHIINKFWKIKQSRKRAHEAYLLRYQHVVVANTNARLKKYIHNDFPKKYNHFQVFLMIRLVIVYHDDPLTFNMGW